MPAFSTSGKVSREQHEAELEAQRRQIRSLEGQLERLIAADRATSTAHAALVAALERQVERAEAGRVAADARTMEVMGELVELKRHDIGALPKGAYEAAAGEDPRASLGGKTNAAIDMFAGGDAELTRHLVKQAQIHRGMLADEYADPTELDSAVADLILAGDT